MSNTTLRAMVFDLDGTLLNTIPDIAGALNRALRAGGLPERALEEYGRIVGGGIREAIRRAAPVGTDQAVLDAVNTRYQGDYPVNCTVETAYYPGIQTLLRRLHEAGVAMAVITNKTETTSLRIIGHFFNDIPFRFIWGNNGQRPLKPAADAGRLACEALQLPPEAVAYVGDSDVDMLFARAAGFLPVGAAWGYRGAAELLDAGAVWLCDSPEALLDCCREAGLC